MSGLVLTPHDQAMLDGEDGPARAMAMRLVVGLGRANDAKRLIDITSAHIDGALYSGPASLDYAERLRDLGGQVKVLTTLNVSSLDLLHPELYRGPAEVEINARATMQAYEDMGCQPTWTCAPYQLPERPAFGDRVAWAESNAVVFANSVLGARSDRFGDFIDIAAALTGRAPEAGMFLDENRRASVHYDTSDIPARLKGTEEFFAVLGLFIGRDVGRQIPVVTGIDTVSEDQLKVMGAALATSGTVPMFHMVGITPEAETLAQATHGAAPRRRDVTLTDLAKARDSLSAPRSHNPLRSINLGAPHYSLAQITRFAALLGDRHVHHDISLYINTGRAVLAAVPDLKSLEAQGVIFVVDTCTYLTPTIIDTEHVVAMSDSAKWAYYAPGNLGIDVIFGSTEDCVESAVAGHLTRAEGGWR